MDRVNVMAWDNRGAPPRQRLAGVEAALLQSPCPIRAGIDAAKPDVSVLHAQVAQSSVLRFRSEAQSIERTTREVVASTPDNVAILAFGRSIDLVDDGRPVSLQAGDLYVYNPGRTFAASHKSGLSFDAYCIARGLLDSSHAWDAPGVVMRRDDATTRLLRAVLAPLPDLANELAPATFLSTLQHAASLAIAAGGDRAGDKAGAARNLRLMRAQVLIAERHRDPGFSVAVAAHELGCSVRLVHQMFEPTGRTFGAFLLDARLRTALTLLQSREQSVRSITALAFASGFNDLSTFHRAFKRMFGVAPRALRAQSGA